ncbi:MAG: SCE4755 family polysaccharide monooxygenase-like protein [Sandaracinaceae bacterium]
MLLGLAVLGPATAHAHIEMSSPTPRTSRQKEGPCGQNGLARGETVAVYEPGETIVIRWTETVNHTSHYRIAFDIDGDDDFVPPADRDDLYNSPAVLLDGIEDMDRNNYAQAVTLPDAECERCTIQLIQMMHGNGNYFQCADIAIRRSDSGERDAGAADDGGSPQRDAGMYGADAGPAADGGWYGADANVDFEDPGTNPNGRVDRLVGTCSAGPVRGGAGAWLLVSLLAAWMAWRRRGSTA